MARGSKRFSDLERQLDVLVAAGATPAAGTPVFEYLQFKKGINKIDVQNPPTAAERKRFLTMLYPFNRFLGATPDPSNLAAVAITALSNTGRNTFQLTNAKLGYESVPGNVTSPEPEFYPALLRIFNKSADAPTTPISGILKKEYKRYAGRSYSVPFGRSGTLITTPPQTLQTVAEEDSRRALAAKVKAVNARASISCQPEEFGSRRADLPALP